MADDNVFFEKREHYVYLKVSGVRNSTAQLLEGTRVVYELSKKFNCCYVLCDFREIDFKLSMSEAFNLVRIYEIRFEDFKNIKIAGVVSPQYFEIAGFWEKISQNRGFENKAFIDVELAGNWLESLIN